MLKLQFDHSELVQKQTSSVITKRGSDLNNDQNTDNCTTYKLPNFTDYNLI